MWHPGNQSSVWGSGPEHIITELFEGVPFKETVSFCVSRKANIIKHHTNCARTPSGFFIDGHRTAQPRWPQVNLPAGPFQIIPSAAPITRLARRLSGHGFAQPQGSRDVRLLEFSCAQGMTFRVLGMNLENPSRETIRDDL